MAGITYKIGSKDVIDLLNLYAGGHLDLEPGFQRQAVWTERDRSNLIDSILRKYPLPAIFLYRREEAGKLVFDVIDGKQRLESILMFMGKMRGRFWARAELPGSDGRTWVDWNLLKKRHLEPLITGYQLPVVEVDGEMGDIIGLFIRINSTGKALTPQEKRHAKYYHGTFLRKASQLANRFERYFRDNRILSAGQISRMKHVELVCELMLSLAKGDVLNKKTALDRVMEAKSVDKREVEKGAAMLVRTLKRLEKMFPHLKTTRLRQVTDFYTLAVLIGKYEEEGLILTDRRRNRLAWDLLKAFSTSVDKMRELQRKVKGLPSGQEIYRDYLVTVSQMTDDVSQRRRRQGILDNLLRSIFARKDAQRGFTAEQRRILWNTTSNRTCSYRGCGKKLTWDDFTIDHIDPHSKGGRSNLRNAALMCRSHNAAKGNRRARRSIKRRTTMRRWDLGPARRIRRAA
jgi:5-methylcytosine-specific restriction endonuclease McrA